MPCREAKNPIWNPINRLPLVAKAIDGMVDLTQAQYAALLQARGRPHVLDDFTVNRVIEAFTTQSNDLSLYKNNSTGGTKIILTTDERARVERLLGQLIQLRELVSSILTLAHKLKEGTIEKVLAKDDLQLGIECLRGKR